jgi:hypothetical protein
VNGDEQGANAAASTLHANVAPVSVAVKLKVGVVSPVVPLGPPVIEVSGGAVATVKLRVAGLGSAPSAPIARTSNVCGPSVSGDAVYSLPQAAKGAESTRHSNVAAGSSDEYVKVGVESLVGPDGPVRMVVPGGPLTVYGDDATLCGSDVVEAVSVHGAPLGGLVMSMSVIVIAVFAGITCWKRG